MFALAFLALSCLEAPVQNDGADWMTYNRNYAGDRYSPLSEIDQNNVKQLRQIAHFDLGSHTNFQSGPIAIDGTVYLSTVTHTYAVDGATGAMKWKHVHPMAKPGGTGAHRGVAYLDGKIFRGFNDGVVAALDAQTGKVLWMTVIANPKVGESLPMAPIAFDGKVFIGNAGGDMYGVTGRIYGLDANNGHQVWMFDCVPKSGNAIKTWPMRNRIPPSGAATWTSFSLDTEKGILYVPAGNPAPDFAPEVRKGQNLYANCVVALNPSTGKLIDYIQPVKNDFHDWDVASAPVLIRSKAGRSMAIIAPKDGLVYGVDRSGVGRSAMAKGMVVRYRTPVTTRMNVNKKFTAKSFTRFAPGVEGG
ncbi:MAG TPA: PQQ-binding-like beta-propeller repeat protein, partial [Fimbriimonadaceae bacterium]|nr:PQQ-binding-like beta-propeller repeat protein [Fimbriimonadaceae bacterium]